MQSPTLRREQKLWRQGFQHIAGVDEAGRGALAGPVVAAAVVLPSNIKIRDLAGVRDSKKLSPTSRETLYNIITAQALAWSVGIVVHTIIDSANIYNASLFAMQHAIDRLSVKPECILIDGKFSQTRLGRLAAGGKSVCIVHGDEKIFSIAAASIIAKVTRDRIMQKLHTAYPQYGFSRHKGYGTALHYRMLKKHGPCKIHRRSFFLG